MEKVYLLWHTHTFADGEDDRSKLIGVYESTAAAEAARFRVAHLRGFVENPQGFEISEYEVGRDHWLEGYIVD